MTVIYALLFALLGLSVGSFLNVLADRLPAKQSIVRPPSHCPGCNRRLAAMDLVPVISYLVLRGRCRYCGVRIPLRVLLVELATGAIFLGLYLYYGLSPELGVAVFYFTLLILVFVVDLEHQLILNVVVYPAMVAVVLINLLLPGLEMVPTFLNGLIGGASGLGLFLVIAILSRGGMGMGDVKMAGLMGLMLGFPEVFAGIMLAVISGGMVALAVMLARRKDRRSPIAFGPFLALGTMAALLWGSVLIDWYLDLFNL